MSKGLAVMSTLGIGAGLMYLMDPQRGRSRRALIRDKAMSWVHKTEDFVQGKATHLRNKAKGVMAEMQPQQGETAFG